MRLVIMLYCMLSVFIFFTGKHIDNIDENNRKAEIRYSLNNAIEDTFKKYFFNDDKEEFNFDEMMGYFINHFMTGVNSEGAMKIRLVGCDETNGVLYINVEETYTNIFGKERVVNCSKALVVEEF